MDGGGAHGQRRSPGRSDPAGPQAFDTWPTARAGHVCRRGRRTAYPRPRAQASSRGRGVSDQRRPFYLRLGDARAMRRLSRRGHPPARHDGSDLRLGRPDAIDGRCARRGLAWHLRICHRRWRLCGAGRSFHGEASTAVPAGGDRHDHSSDRRFVDASGNQLGRAAVCRP